MSAVFPLKSNNGELPGTWKSAVRYGEGHHAFIEDTVESLIRRWQWQGGDIMLGNHLQVPHGRDPFVGDRETLAALFA